MEQAKADGRWERVYHGPASIEVPEDLERALAARPAAGDLFAKLGSQNRYAILYRIHEAKRVDTRARRIERFVEMLAAGETPYPQR